MPDGDIFELNVDQVYNGQNLTNVLHFVQAGTDGSGSVLEALELVWFDEFRALHLAILVDTVEIVQLRARQLFPTQTQQRLLPIGEFGAFAETGLPPQQCAILSQKGERGGPKGRRGAGHMKVSGVPVTVVDTGRVTAAYGTLMNLLGVAFITQFTNAISGFTFDSVTLSMVDDVPRKIEQSFGTSRIRTVYSRSIGVGQ